MEVKTYLTFLPRVPRAVRYAGLLTLLLGLVSILCSAANPPTLVVQWNNAALQGDRDSSFGPPMIARALAIVHTCMYDAWAAYDAKAIGTQLGGTLRRPASERTLANKQKAISYGAYRALVDLFAFDKSLFDAQMASLGYDPTDNSTDITTPTGIGNIACAAVLNFRHSDGSNQLGDPFHAERIAWLRKCAALISTRRFGFHEAFHHRIVRGWIDVKRGTRRRRWRGHL